MDPGGGDTVNDGLLSVLLDGALWAPGADGGFLQRIVEHLGYTGLALVIAFLIAFPVGLLIGHTDRFAFLAINSGNAGRSLPTLGLIAIIVVIFGIGLLPITVALVVLAIPPILTNTYAAIRAVDPHTVDASRGMGMTEPSILLRVELPNGLPLIFGGLRNATLQVVSTATVAAYVGSGGLGRYLIDGIAVRDYSEVFAGAVLVGVLAVVLDTLLAGVQRLVVSPGVSGRAATRRSGPVPAPSQPTER
ncbi:ABC transporter permease [Nocardioides aequoreus]|uniref:ABC transporter permease n=1 Tax=Nocardioides aequoreus TaxID=397278 RepID=UPI000A01E597|nr:ABC transporter permease [Nocardioides aequoreus]